MDIHIWSRLQVALILLHWQNYRKEFIKTKRPAVGYCRMPILVPAWKDHEFLVDSVFNTPHLRDVLLMTGSRCRYCRRRGITHVSTIYSVDGIDFSSWVLLVRIALLLTGFVGLPSVPSDVSLSVTWSELHVMLSLATQCAAPEDDMGKTSDLKAHNTGNSCHVCVCVCITNVCSTECCLVCLSQHCERNWLVCSRGSSQVRKQLRQYNRIRPPEASVVDSRGFAALVP